MTEPKQKTKKLSRRDAIKLLGAAVGASVLANLPSKWSTPELASGILPAHAQTSGGLLFIDGGFIPSEEVRLIPQDRSGVQEIKAASQLSCSFVGTHWVQISQPIADIPLVLATNPTSGPTWYIPTSSPDGTYYTDPDGKVYIDIDVVFNGSIIFNWTFQNPNDGTDNETFILDVCGFPL